MASVGYPQSRSLIWHILDEISTKKGFKNIIQISHFVELAFNLRKKICQHWFGAFLWHNNCRKCRKRDTLKFDIFRKKIPKQFKLNNRQKNFRKMLIFEKWSITFFKIFSASISGHKLGAFWQVPIWALDRKLFTGLIYSSQ
jgi:hypothetical protein